MGGIPESALICLKIVAFLHFQQRHVSIASAVRWVARNAASFEEWVEKCLVPTLSQGDVVVMDNLSRTSCGGGGGGWHVACDICRLTAPT